MPRKKSKAPEASEHIIGLTPNQIVAFNLAEARLWRNWTQEEAAEALEPYLGVRWSKGSFSAAERSVDGGRVRQFSADEIVAFARAFDLPVGWFFLPPPAWHAGKAVKVLTPDGGPNGVQPSELIDVVFGTAEQQAVIEMRLQSYLQDLGVDRLTDTQEAIRRTVNARVEEIVRHSLGQLADAQTMLRALANHLEDIETRAKMATLGSDLDPAATDLATRPIDIDPEADQP